MYLDQNVKIRLDQQKAWSVKISTWVILGWYFSSILFKLYNEYVSEVALNGFDSFDSRGQLIGTVRYTDEFVIVGEEEAVLQGMVDRVIEVGKCCGMEVNVENTKGVDNSERCHPQR